MGAIFLAIWPLLLAATLLIGGNGLQGTALAVRGTIEQFPAPVLGLIFSTYALGFMFGCRYAARFVASVGHIRAFTAFASLASASALAHAMIVWEPAWLVLRLVTGFSFAAMYMILESWLNEASTNENRGKVFSVYRITDLISVTAAQFLLLAFDLETFLVFAAISIAFSLALVPVALTRIVAPPLPNTARLNLRRLWRVSPASVAGVLGVGLSGAAWWSMMPLFVAAYGFPPSSVGVIIGAIIFGGALSQYPIGRLSDMIDRRIVMLICSGTAVVFALLIPMAAQNDMTTLTIAAVLLGAAYLPNYGLAVAHANDHAEPGTALSVNGGILMLHGAAAVVGPIVASGLVGVFGPAAVFYFVAVVFGAVSLFVFIRRRQRPDPDDKLDYVAVSRTASTGAASLDPRVPADSGTDLGLEPADG